MQTVWSGCQYFYNDNDEITYTIDNFKIDFQNEKTPFTLHLSLESPVFIGISRVKGACQPFTTKIPVFIGLSALKVKGEGQKREYAILQDRIACK